MRLKVWQPLALPLVPWPNPGVADLSRTGPYAHTDSPRIWETRWALCASSHRWHVPVPVPLTCGFKTTVVISM